MRSVGFLDTVVPAVRRSLEEPGYDRGVPPRRKGSPPSFGGAIRSDPAHRAVLVEYKRVSPGRSDAPLPLRAVSEFLARTAGAPVAAFSCLATMPEFRGSPADVSELAAQSPLPVLFKEFVVDPRQLEVAARTGASAVLLIARLPDGGRKVEPLSDLADAAHRLGLEVVLEFHHRSELSRAAEVAADVYGVNSRNLDTLAIDRPTAIETLRAADRDGLRPLLGLSGVESPSDARAFWDAGVDGILVGSAVARSKTPVKFLRSIRDVPRSRDP